MDEVEAQFQLTLVARMFFCGSQRHARSDVRLLRMWREQNFLQHIDAIIKTTRIGIYRISLFSLFLLFLLFPLFFFFFKPRALSSLLDVDTLDS